MSYDSDQMSLAAQFSSNFIDPSGILGVDHRVDIVMIQKMAIIPVSGKLARRWMTQFCDVVAVDAWEHSRK